MKRYVFVFLLGICYTISLSQETWDLRQCVDYALKNNIGVKQAELQIQFAEIDLKQDKLSRLPNLNLSSNAGYQFGRTIDPVTNDFNNRTIGFQTISINTGFPLYTGGSISNSVEQSKLDLQAAKMDTEQTRNDIALNVAIGYLNVLLAEEQLDNAEKRLEISREQLKNTDKLIEAGALPANDRLDLLALISRDEQSRIAAENGVANSYLALKNLLRLDPSKEIVIAKPVIEVPITEDPDEYRVKVVYEKALETQPFIEAGKLRRKSAALGVNIARSGLLPSLRAFGNINSNYSSLATRLDGFRTETFQQDLTITDFPGMNEDITLTVESSQQVPVFMDNPYVDQLDENFGQSFGLSLSIPLYNRNTTRANMERARLSEIQQELQNELDRQNLKSDVQSAIAEARTAKRQWLAAQRTLDSQRAAFQNTERKFKLGSANTLEYTTSKNNLDQAETDLTIAKYDYLFKLKVVDYYLGNQITLD